MLNARKDAAYTYVFTGVIPALTPITPTVIDNNVIIKKAPEKIVTETAYITLALAAAQARNSLVDLIAA